MAAVVLQIKAEQKNLWLIFDIKFVGKCSGLDNFILLTTPTDFFILGTVVGHKL